MLKFIKIFGGCKKNTTFAEKFKTKKLNEKSIDYLYLCNRIGVMQ